MAHERLELLKRHPAAEAGSGVSVAELVRINVQTCPLTDLMKDYFQGAGLQRLMRCADADKQGIRVIGTDLQVFPKCELRLCVKVNSARFSTFTAEDPDGSVIEVNVRKPDEGALADSTAGGKQEVDKSLFTYISAWLGSPALLFSSCETLGKSLNFSKPQFTPSEGK